MLERNTVNVMEKDLTSILTQHISFEIYFKRKIFILTYIHAELTHTCINTTENTCVCKCKYIGMYVREFIHVQVLKTSIVSASELCIYGLD